MTTATPDPDAAMTQIREGMRVVDDSGAQIGTVAGFKMGDPTAVTTEGQHTGETDEPRIPEELAARLLRAGYVRIRMDGLFRRDAYAASDEIADVSDDVVSLTVGGDWLATED
jgi:hypothetical protein